MTVVQNSIDANATTPLNTTDGGTGVSNPLIHGVLIAEGASPCNSIVLSAGQTLIGTTGGDPVAATLTAGSGITITSVTGNITISATSAISSYVYVTSSTYAMLPNQCYISSYPAGFQAFSLPATSSFGDVIQILPDRPGGSNTFTVTQGAGQVITLQSFNTTTVGTSGSLGCEAVYMICIVANTTWSILTSYGATFI